MCKQIKVRFTHPLLLLLLGFMMVMMVMVVLRLSVAVFVLLTFLSWRAYSQSPSPLYVGITLVNRTIAKDLGAYCLDGSLPAYHFSKGFGSGVNNWILHLEFSQSKIISPQEQTGESVDVCIEDETVNYLNQKDVQKALHARLVNVRQWTVCSDILDYQLLDVEIPTITVVSSLVQSGIPVLVYSGDQDSVIPLTGSRTLVHQLAGKLRLNTTTPYRVWFAGEQVGGWTEVYGNMLSFATVRGASHEAPYSQPARSLVLFKSFLQRQPLPEVL